MAGTEERGWSTRSHRRGPGDRGFMMVALLIGMGITAIWMTAALPFWRQQVQRTREEELIFRGEQYARAIVLYYVKNRGTYPQNIDVLVSQHYLRKKWKDPVTNDDFALAGVGIINLPGAGQSTPVGGQTPTPAGGRGQGGATAVGGTGQPGITGVRSKSNAASIKVYQQQQQYNLWQFDAQLIAPKMGVNLNAAAQQGQGGRQGGQGQAPGAGRGQQGTGMGAGGAGQQGRGGAGTGPGRGGGTTPPTTPPATGTGRGRGGN